MIYKANTSKASRREVEEGQVRKEMVKENGPTYGRRGELILEVSGHHEGIGT